jgi:hypothetical protein
VTEQALDVLAGALRAAAEAGAPVPDGLTASAGDTLDALLADLSGYERVDVSVHSARATAHIAFIPTRAHETLETKRTAPAGLAGGPTPRVVEGVLYAVDLHSGRFRVVDDAGNSIALRVPTGLMEGVEALLARRVRAVGAAHVTAQGRLIDVDVTGLSVAPDIEGLEHSSFWSGRDLHADLRQRLPLRSLDDLAIEGLTDEEAEGFWSAIQGRDG